MNSSAIAAIMIHVPDVEKALSWYARAFTASIRSMIPDADFEVLTVNGMQLEFVLADDKVTCGACGSVVYWHVPAIEAAIVRLQGIGATLYRGPMEIEQGLHICQVRDPWGNCIGLRGPLRLACDAPEL